MAMHVAPNLNCTNPRRLVEKFWSQSLDLYLIVYSFVGMHDGNRIAIHEVEAGGGLGKKIIESSMTNRQVRYSLAAGNYRLA